MGQIQIKHQEKLKRLVEEDMLNPLLSSGSAFDTSKTVLWQWLNKNADVVKTLALKDLSIYGNNRFICGWMIDITTSNQTFEFHILLDTYFPYSPIRIAYKTNDFFLKWPHVEPNGLLCLPVENSDGIEEKIYKNLFNAIELIENCQNSEQFREKEFQDEFISYWNHSTGSVKINSLLDIN
ncbi:E2/UBC family protein, partial [Acinetobacter baumannii]|uniref:E2/UBC family protein n=3 Tax=Acinetobacter TaxID=469 RepID=UPI003D06D4DA